jgi:hypothetical protein
MSACSEARQIGPVGTVGRIGVGVVAIGLPIASAGIGPWDWAALNVFVLVAAALGRAVIVGFERYAPDVFDARHAFCSAPACVLIAALAAVAFGLSALTPAQGDVVFWVWLGASMLVGAARGYGGCEVLAFPNALTGRRDRIGCILFTPIDAAEARIRSQTSRRAVLGGD